jgi:hypothetical protein
MIPLGSVSGRVPQVVCYSASPLVSAGPTSGNGANPAGGSLSYYGMAQSSTGYITVAWWNGTKTTYGSGATLADIGFTSDWINTGSTKRIVLYASNSTGGQRGYIRNLKVEKWHLTGLNVTANTELVGLKISKNDLTSLDLSPMKKLRLLHFRSNLNTSLDVSRCSSLKALYAGGGRNAIFLFSDGKTEEPRPFPRRPSALTTITFGAANSSLTTLVVQGSGVTAMNLTHLTGLYDLKCNDNPVSSLTMPTGGFTFGFFPNSGVTGGILSVCNTALSAASLNSIYSALPTAVGEVYINVVGASGAGAANHATATGKGYGVYTVNQF